jgi:hypothetical protein
VLAGHCEKHCVHGGKALATSQPQNRNLGGRAPARTSSAKLQGEQESAEGRKFISAKKHKNLAPGCCALLFCESDGVPDASIDAGWGISVVLHPEI